MNMRPLPPFDSLVAFEATVRNGSFTRAAAELGLTQSAVSHRLRKLEAFVGTPLLTRRPNGILPTASGLAMASALVGLLDRLGDVRALCRAAMPPQALKVGVGAALADHWLVRRLPLFTEAHPGIPIELMVLESDAQARTLALDVTIHWQPVALARQTSTQRVLAREHIFPVCHPRLLPGGRPLAEPSALKSLPLIHKGRAGDDSGPEWSWTTWFTRLQLGRPPAAAVRLATISPAIAAALAGGGVALVRSLLAKDAIAEERLVRLLPPTWDMLSSKVQVVRWPAAMAQDKRVAAFVNWTLQMAKGVKGK